MIFGKKKKTVEYIEKEILYFSLGLQELFKKWLIADMDKDGEITPKVLSEELKKFDALVCVSFSVRIREDYSDEIADKFDRIIADFQKNYRVTGDFLFQFAYGAIMDEMPSKDIITKSRSIKETQEQLCKLTTAEVLEGI